MFREIVSRINLFVIGFSLVIVFGLFGLTLLIGWLFNPVSQNEVKPTAALVIIEAPTLTPSPVFAPTDDVKATQQALAAGGQIFKGGYVQITGTDGDGLRLRSGPGLSYDQIFLGYDSELFIVEDGPQESDGFTWWYLVAPYDENRSGWAAGTYLGVVVPE